MDPARLARGLSLLESVVTDRLEAHVDSAERTTRTLDAYGLDPELFADLDAGRDLPTGEQVLLLLALVPHVRPDFCSRLIGQFLPEGGDLPEFGGVRSGNHRGVLPTGETAQFVLAGDELAGRLEVARLLSAEHWFARRHVL